MKDTGPRPDDRIVAEGDPGGHIYICGNPDALSHRYGLVRGLEMRIVMIMTRSAKKASLRDDRMLADLDRRDGIEPGIVADPRIIADLDPPGEMEPRPGMHYDLLSDFTPENFEQPPAKTIARQGRKPKQGLLAEEPQENEKFRAAIVEPGMVPLVKTEEGHLSAHDLLMERLRPDFPQPGSRRDPSLVNEELKSGKKGGDIYQNLTVGQFPQLSRHHIHRCYEYSIFMASSSSWTVRSTVFSQVKSPARFPA